MLGLPDVFVYFGLPILIMGLALIIVSVSHFRLSRHVSSMMNYFQQSESAQEEQQSAIESQTPAPFMRTEIVPAQNTAPATRSVEIAKIVADHFEAPKPPSLSPIPESVMAAEAKIPSGINCPDCGKQNFASKKSLWNHKKLACPKTLVLNTNPQSNPPSDQPQEEQPQDEEPQEEQPQETEFTAVPAPPELLEKIRAGEIKV